MSESIGGDRDLRKYAKARIDAMIRLGEIINRVLPDSASYEEALDQYNDSVKAVKDYAYFERRLFLHIALNLARTLDRLNLIPKHRIAYKVCYVDLREYLDIDGGNRDSFVTPRWLANALPIEYRKKLLD